MTLLLDLVLVVAGLLLWQRSCSEGDDVWGSVPAFTGGDRSGRDRSGQWRALAGDSAAGVGPRPAFGEADRRRGEPLMNPRGPDIIELMLVGLILALLAFRFSSL